MKRIPRSNECKNTGKWVNCAFKIDKTDHVSVIDYYLCRLEILDSKIYTNSLINASSPYLLQHAHNPVDWNEWNEETWARAKTEDKLVLVSIGYSACHWCHVMEKHCFEDEKLAKIMNAWFINIKVDREERPDVDMVYMDACQVMTGRGGWPLNVFCLPDGRPIYTGTYFPPESWEQTLIQLSNRYKTEKSKTIEFAEQMMQSLIDMNSKTLSVDNEKFNRKDIIEMYGNMSKNFDWQQGGRKGAPKFPMPNNLEFVLDHYLISRNKETADFLHLSLMKMANGGINDHIRGGFCRYSVDAQWFAPHFEKMLYDNAQLISLYARAFAVFDAPLYKTVAMETLAFCLNELKSPGGGFYSALDADSEGEEGRFYVFTDKELQQALNPEEYRIACIAFSVRADGNWEHNNNILHKSLAPLQVLEKAGIDAKTYTTAMITIREKLLILQNKRVRPGLDNKIITAWNGLMITALANASLFLQDEKYLREAEALGNWIWNTMYVNDVLYRIFAKGKATIRAFSEDYATLIVGYLALFESNHERYWLDRALVLADDCISHFYAPQLNIFEFSGSESEALIFRKADISDDVISSANSILCLALQKLGVLTDRDDLIQIGARMLRSAAAQVKKYPGWYSNWAKAAQKEAIGSVTITLSPASISEIPLIIKDLPSWLIVKTDPQISAQYILCNGNTCFEPVHSLEQLHELIMDLLLLEE